MRAWAFAFVVVAFLLPAEAGDLRDALIKMHWEGRLPTEKEMAAEPEPGKLRRKPLLVYIPNPNATRDQERFEEVCLKIQQFVLASRFFECAQVTESVARQHPLLKDLKFKVPTIVLFDWTLKKSAVVRSRASAMKAYGAMRKIGQPGYKTLMKETLRKAKVLLGTLDQVEAMRETLGNKEKRLISDRDKGKPTKKLERDIAKDRAKIDGIHDKAMKEWNALFKLERKLVPAK